MEKLRRKGYGIPTLLQARGGSSGSAIDRDAGKIDAKSFRGCLGGRSSARNVQPLRPKEGFPFGYVPGMACVRACEDRLFASSAISMGVVLSMYV